MLDTNGVERSRFIPVSALHDVHRKVEGYGSRVFALHIGEPHLGIPEPVKEAFVRAVRDGCSSYCDAPGLPELREALAASVSAKVKSSVPADHVFVTPGSCQGISAVLMSLAQEGASIMLPEIYWPMHLHQIVMTGLQPRFYGISSLHEDPIGTLEKAYERSVRAIVVCSPSNPTGQVLDRNTITRIYEWARSRRVLIISDEAYEDFVFEGEASIMGALDAAVPLSERIVFAIRTFSKNYSMTGYRLGYVVAPNAERAALLLRVQEATLVSPCTPVQYAGLAALACADHVIEHREYVRATRDAVLSLLAERKLTWIEPRGGWYAVLDLSGYGDDSDTLCDRMLTRAAVAIAPARSFGPPGHPRASQLARLAFCRERQYTLTAVRRMLDYLGHLRPVSNPA